MDPVRNALVQPRKNWCGPAALRNALLWHGVRASTARLAHDSLTRCGCEDAPRGPDGLRTRWRGGRCEHGLRRAARARGFDVRHHLYRTEGPAWQKLVELLDPRDPTPVLVCVDRWRHWMVAVRATVRHVWICDSLGDWDGPNDSPVYQRHGWREFMGRVARYKPGDLRFDLYPVVVRETSARP